MLARLWISYNIERFFYTLFICTEFCSVTRRFVSHKIRIGYLFIYNLYYGTYILKFDTY